MTDERKDREMTDENETTEDLQENATDDNIEASEPNAPASAVSSGNESGDAQERIIEQQQSTIDALLARTEQLTKQLNILVSNGVQITDETPNAPQTRETDPDEYVSLSDLGREFGKR